MSLLAPAFLAGLLAVGIPLWLHRLSSDNPNRRPFSSVMFLEAGEPQRVLARKLQYWLLLAFRIAVIAFLAFAFMQPAFWRDPAAGALGDQRLHLIVIDTSASMAAGDRFDDAIDTAIDLIDATPAADPVQIIAAGRVLEVVTGATLDKAIARQSVQSLEPGVFFVDFGQLTRALDGVLRSAALPVRLHVVTDAQASGFPTRFSDLAPTEPVEIEVHAVAEAAEPNWALEDLSGSAQTGELAATIRSFGDAAASRNLSLELNGSRVDSQSVELEPGAQAVVEFDALTLAEGANRVRLIMTPEDALAGDDLRMLALNRPVPHPVLIVSGALTGTDDTLYLETTMQILEGLAFAATTINAAELADYDFEDFEFVVVTDAGALDADDAERLEDYVATGGGLLLALGPRSDNLVAVPVTGHEFAASAGALLGRSVASSISVGTIERSHPAINEIDTIRAARFWDYAAIEETADDEVLIRLQSGDPLLLAHELGNGRLLVYTSTLDREWNDLPKEPAFVPLIAGIADHLLGGAGFANEAALGSTLALQAMGMSGGQIFDPEGDPVLGLGGAGTDIILDQIGFYQLVGGGRDELVAVNFDVRESNLAPADPAALARWQEFGREPAAAAPGQALSEEVLVPIGYWLLLLLLVVAVVESAIGNWHLRVRRGIAA